MTYVIVQVSAAADRPDERGQAVPTAQQATTVPDEPRGCSELTAAGQPCKGRAGDDGLCAAHKAKAV